MSEVDILIPCYKNIEEIRSLLNSLKEQENIKINKIVCPLTLSNEETDKAIKEIFKENNVISFDVLPNEFSHSLTRDKAIREYCSSHIVVLISQDVKLVNKDSIANLVKSIADGESAYNYGRQICPKKCIEKYIRENNYPSTSRFINKDDISSMQIMAFFASDAFSAIDRDVFIKINGYQGKDVSMSEDMLYSYYLLNEGYTKRYCADAVVIHYHELKLKQLYKRYYDTGIFYKKMEIFNNYKSNDAGVKLAIYVLKQCFKHFDIKSLFIFFPNMLARYLGMKKGKKAR